MKRFLSGLAVGLVVGSAGVALAATIVGSSGYLFGWAVKKDGDEICSSPHVWTATREIECD